MVKSTCYVDPSWVPEHLYKKLSLVMCSYYHNSAELRHNGTSGYQLCSGFSERLCFKE